jgi:hypothetical protein
LQALVIVPLCFLPAFPAPSLPSLAASINIRDAVLNHALIAASVLVAAASVLIAAAGMPVHALIAASADAGNCRGPRTRSLRPACLRTHMAHIVFGNYL